MNNYPLNNLKSGQNKYTPAIKRKSDKNAKTGTRRNRILDQTIKNKEDK